MKDFANGAIQRERVFRDKEDLLAHDGNWLISRIRGQSSWNCAQSCGRRWSATQRHNQLGLCQSTLSRAMPAELNGIICISAGISNSHNAVEQANIKVQFAARAGIPHT